MKTFRYFVGLDWGSTHHEAAVEDEEGTVLFKRTIGNELEAIFSFADELGRLVSPDSTAIGIETKDHVLIAVLMAKGFRVFHLNPLKSNRLRDRVSISGAKTDELDAKVIASALRKDFEMFHPILEPDATVFKIARLLDTRERFKSQAEALLNHVWAELSRTFPDILRLGSLYNAAWLRELVLKYPVPSEARKATAADVEQLVRRTSKVDAAALLKMLTSARSGYAAGIEVVFARCIRAELECANRFLYEADHIYRQLGQELARLEQTTSDGKPSDVAILLSVPGVGAVACATLLSQASGALAKRDLRGLRTISGTAPVTQKSGKQGRRGGPKPLVLMRRACRKDLRNAFFSIGANLMQRDPRTRDYYRGLRARGIGHAAAIRRVGDQAARLMITLLTKQELFDSGRRQQHGNIAGGHGTAKEA